MDLTASGPTRSRLGNRAWDWRKRWKPQETSEPPLAVPRMPSLPCTVTRSSHPGRVHRPSPLAFNLRFSPTHSFIAKLWTTQTAGSLVGKKEDVLLGIRLADWRIGSDSGETRLIGTDRPRPGGAWRSLLNGSRPSSASAVTLGPGTGRSARCLLLVVDRHTRPVVGAERRGGESDGAI